MSIYLLLPHVLNNISFKSHFPNKLLLELLHDLARPLFLKHLFFIPYFPLVFLYLFRISCKRFLLPISSAYQDLDLINCNKSGGGYAEMLSGKSFIRK